MTALSTGMPEGGFDLDTIMVSKERRKVDRFIIFALAASEEALAQAHWKPVSNDDRRRNATIIIASDVRGFPAIPDAVHTVDQHGVRRLSPFTIPSFSVNVGACRGSIRHGFKRPLALPLRYVVQAFRQIAWLETTVNTLNNALDDGNQCEDSRDWLNLLQFLGPYSSIPTRPETRRVPLTQAS